MKFSLSFSLALSFTPSPSSLCLSLSPPSPFSLINIRVRGFDCTYVPTWAFSSRGRLCCFCPTSGCPNTILGFPNIKVKPRQVKLTTHVHVQRKSECASKSPKFQYNTVHICYCGSPWFHDWDRSSKSTNHNRVHHFNPLNWKGGTMYMNKRFMEHIMIASLSLSLPPSLSLLLSLLSQHFNTYSQTYWAIKW